MTRQEAQTVWRADAGCSVRACSEAVLEVLETMFFEIPLDEPALRAKAPERAVSAMAAFSGGLRGALWVACEPWAARRLAAGFLGREDESTIDESEVRLVACEMANMICGNVVSRIDPHVRFQIETPVPGAECEDAPGWLTFPLETGSVAVCLRIEAT